MKQYKMWVMLFILVIGLILTGCAKNTAAPEGNNGLTTDGGQTQVASSTSNRACDDSIDGGNNPYVKGITSVNYKGDVTTYEDNCVEDYLKEYYCDANEYRSYKKLCAYGCENGACFQTEKVVEEVVPQTSHESDRPIEDEDANTIVPHCTNGYKDGDETDVDCGASCPNCGYGKMCRSTSDCEAPYFCNYRSKICLETKS